MDIDTAASAPSHHTTCRYCSTSIRWASGRYRDVRDGVHCTPGRPGRHAPVPARTSATFDLIFGADGADDALTASLRRAGN